VSATKKAASYLRGLVAGFEGRTVGERPEEIQTADELAEWQDGWCDAHQIGVSLGVEASDKLRAGLRQVP